MQAIAEAHHGSVRVRSASGHGATFELVIPAVPGARPGDAPSGAALAGVVQAAESVRGADREMSATEVTERASPVSA